MRGSIAGLYLPYTWTGKEGQSLKDGHVLFGADPSSKINCANDLLPVEVVIF